MTVLLRSPAGGRLARRLFVLFVGVALLPLAVSDWLSHIAATQVASDLQRQRQGQTTRQVSRQVFDRLLAARLLIESWPAVPAQAPSAGVMPGLGAVFVRAAQVDAAGHLAWTSDAQAAEALAGFPAIGDSPRPTLPRARETAVQLHVMAPAGRAPAIWLHRATLTTHWLAEVDPAHLWGPVRDAGDDAAWLVRDAHGRTLLSLRGADYPGDAASPGTPARDATTFDAASPLFLDGSFATGDWTFVQRAPQPVVRWLGHPLGAWLALVAAATLLTIAWLARRQIRRLLEPLERLTIGTSQLAAGHGRTRVVVRRDDEIGRLASSFNHMAERIEAQFDALAGMTAIDRDILDGAPLPRVAERVLDRLADECPQAVTAVAWLDGPHRLVHAWRGAASADGKTHTATTTLDEDMCARWHALDTELLGPAEAFGPAPWLPPPPGGGTDDVLVLLPVRLQECTAAVVTLRLPAPVTADLQQRASNLRDRLSVAMAARSREQELVHRAAHDSLTGLVNRYGLHQRLDAWLTSPQAELAVLFIDLDHFKDVNDSRGHAAGDELLCEASARLQSVASAKALVSRQGGDEFAIVLPGADATQAEACARAVVTALGRPFVLRETTQVLGASVGVSLCPAHGREREELLRRADVALYAAKAAGRGRHVLFTPEFDAAAQERLTLLAELRTAIEREEFVVHYQPRVQASDGTIRSAEALVRWAHPQRGLVMPGAFIGLAESAGLIDAIGGLVLEGACRQLACWQRDGVAIARVSVNVSPQQLASGRLPALVRALLDRHRLPGHLLELEVTESLLVGDAVDAATQLAQVRAWGVTIAMDDFGTGYSSMSVLRQLPIDVMKVDRSFVTDVCDDRGALAVTRAIVALAKSMSLHLVAEGVETEAQAALLARLGCDELQGFLYSRAVPAEQLAQLSGLRRPVTVAAPVPTAPDHMAPSEVLVD